MARTMSRRLAHFLGMVLTTAAGCAPPGAVEVDPEIVAAVMQSEIPPALEGGERAFDANCTECHGRRALGTEQGPPLVHIVYEPSHHADGAFVLAVQRGVRAHHWGFGDMAPIPGLSGEEVAEIIAYVRFLQRQAGIG